MDQGIHKDFTKNKKIIKLSSVLKPFSQLTRYLAITIFNSISKYKNKKIGVSELNRNEQNKGG